MNLIRSAVVRIENFIKSICEVLVFKFEYLPPKITSPELFWLKDCNKSATRTEQNITEQKRREEKRTAEQNRTV